MGLLDNQYSFGAVSPLLNTDTYQEMLRKKILAEQAKAQPQPQQMNLGGSPPPQMSMPQVQAQGLPVDPQTGLTEQQRLLMGQQFFGNLGANLLAAGQKLTPAQRAEYLSKLGQGTYDPNKASEMALRNQLTNKSARENAQQLNLINMIKTPEFQKSLQTLDPASKTLLTYALSVGDVSAASKIIDDNTGVSLSSTGVILDKGNKTYTDTVTGQSGSLRQPAIDSETTSRTAGPVDTKALGLPEGTEVSPNMGKYSSSFQKQLADIFTGRMTLDQLSKGNAYLKQRLLTATYDAFGDAFDPQLSANANAINKSMVDQKSPRSLYNLKNTLGTFVRHLGEEDKGLLDIAKSIPNTKLLVWNEATKEFLNQTGDPRITAFNTRLHQVQGELGKMIIQGQLTVDETRRLEGQLSAANSPEQMRAALDAYVDLAEGKAKATDDASQSATQHLYDPKRYSVYTDQMNKILDRYKKDTWGKAKTNSLSGTTSTNTPWKVLE